MKAFDQCHSEMEANRIEDHEGDCPKVRVERVFSFQNLTTLAQNTVSVDLVMFSIETVLNVWFTIELLLRFVTCDARLEFM